VSIFGVVNPQSGAATINGVCFIASHIFRSVAKDGVAEFLIKVAAGEKLSLDISGPVGGKVAIDSFRTPTIVADGTSVPFINANDNSSNTINTTLFHTPNTSADGTPFTNSLVLRREQVGISFNSASSTPVILKASTNYLLRLTNEERFNVDMSFFIRIHNVPASV